MNENEINKLVSLRIKLIKYYEKTKDYRNNKNAIMREIDHAKILHEAIVGIDSVLKEHVEFTDKK